MTDGQTFRTADGVETLVPPQYVNHEEYETALRTDLKRLRHELHRARIGMSVAIAMLPPQLVDACAAEIDRQVADLNRAHAATGRT